MAEYDVHIFSDSDDEDLVDYINILHRRPYTIRQRPNHFNAWDDQDFFNRFRFTKETVQLILEQIEEIIRFPTNRNSAVSPLQQLLMCIRFYASGSMLITIGDFGGIHKSTLCKIIQRVTAAICTLRERLITLPKEEEQLAVTQGFYNIALFPRVLLALDCTHVRIQSPGGHQAEQFRNRKGYFSLNVQVACDHRMKIRDIVARWPGATHDSNIFHNSFLKATLEQNVGNSVILGDSGYPNLNYLMTPLLHPITQAEALYNEAHIRTRNIIERTFGVWKRRFPVLAYGLRLQLPTIQDVIVATAILHNIAVNEHEEVPEVEPNILALIEDVIPVDNYQGENNNFVRNELINNYFSRL